MFTSLGLSLGPCGGRLGDNCLSDGLGSEWPVKGCRNNDWVLEKDEQGLF
jgi:hypothetical protein